MQCRRNEKTGQDNFPDRLKEHQAILPLPSQAFMHLCIEPLCGFLFCRKLIIIFGILIPLCIRKRLGIFCVTQDYASAFIALITQQDTDPNRNLDFVIKVWNVSIYPFLDTVCDSHQDLAIGHIFEQHIESVRVKSGNCICGPQQAS
mgnify:CR=1 FL=1